MKSLSIKSLKRELVALIHFNQVINDFVDIMQFDVIRGLDPTYFTEVCRDFVKMIDDSPYVTDYLKGLIGEFLINKINTQGSLADQSHELNKLSSFIANKITYIREDVLVNDPRLNHNDTY